VSYRKGHRYLTVVVDHDSGRLLWATPGRDETLHRFFDALGERTQNITLVIADAASWVANVVRARAPNAVRCMDPFHVVQWATKALDEVRRQLWNPLRETGKGDLASTRNVADFANGYLVIRTTHIPRSRARVRGSSAVPPQVSAHPATVGRIADARSAKVEAPAHRCPDTRGPGQCAV
jgi:transposase